MTMPPAYSYATIEGPIWILPGLAKTWHVIWDGEDLGAYATPEEAGQDAWRRVGAHAKLGVLATKLPRALRGWHLHLPATG